MKTAVFKAILLYVVGFSAAVIIYLMADSHYAHGPNLYHIVFLFTIFIGLVWLLVALGQYYIYPRKHILGYIFINGAAVLGFVIFIGILNYQNEKASLLLSDESLDRDEVMVARMGDSTLMYHNDNIIYLQVKDSVYFDLRDSAHKKIDSSKE